MLNDFIIRIIKKLLDDEHANNNIYRCIRSGGFSVRIIKLSSHDNCWILSFQGIIGGLLTPASFYQDDRKTYEIDSIRLEDVYMEVLKSDWKLFRTRSERIYRYVEWNRKCFG